MPKFFKFTIVPSLLALLAASLFPITGAALTYQEILNAQQGKVLGTSTISLVSSTSATSGGGGATTPAINTTGASLIVMVAATFGANTAAVSDSAGNTWTGLTTYNASDNSRFVKIFYTYAPITSASQTFSCTGNFPSCVVSAWSGTATTAAVFDAQNGAATSNGVTSLGTGSITPASSGELIISGFSGSACWGGTSMVIDSGLSIFGTNGGGCAGEIAYAASMIAPSTAAVSPTWSWISGQSGQAAAIAAFKPAVTGPADTAAPTTPQNFSATAVSQSQVNLSWNSSTDDTAVTGYSIYRGGVQIATSGSTSYSDTGLTSATAYTYKVDAFDAAGNHSAQSTSANATTQSPPPPDSTPPATPSNLLATAISSSGINLSWNASTDNIGVTGYKIFRSGSQIGTSATASYSDSGLSPSTLYSYTVSANDAAGNNSSQSSSQSATTQAQAQGGGRTITAASCSQSDVQTAVNQELSNPADGDIISIPAGTCTWSGTTQISATFTKSVTIQGAGAVSSTNGGAGFTGSDATVIIDNMNHASGPGSSMSFGAPAGKSLRITGIAFLTNGSSSAAGTGILSVGGASTSVRIDHNHFYLVVGVGVRLNGAVLGVMDHNYFDAQSGVLTNDFAMHNGGNWNGDTAGWGDVSWTDTDHFGSSLFFFIEDNRFHNGDPGDSSTGGRYVMRYNTIIVDALTSLQGQMFNHGLTPGRDRSMRAAEIYNNTFTQPGNPGSGGPSYSMNGGTLLFWGNTITQYRHGLDLDYTRKNNGAYGFSATPSGWGYCGTNFNGTGSNWDQNSNTSTGYACMDGPGRGAGDLLTSPNLPNVVNARTGTIAWPQQVRSPIYIWSNNYTPSSGYSGTSLVSATSVIIENSDYYQQAGGFNGTVGVGSGPLSARPSTCTAGPGGNTTGVGYWATDNNTLYVCNPTNTWTVYYTPYQYPHPLVSGSVVTPPPPPPPTPVPGDFNLDHVVNSLDYSGLNINWFKTVNISTYDLQADGIINSFDFAILKSNWGKTW